MEAQKHIEDQEPLVRAYKHNPRIVPPGMEVFELDLITGRVRPAEWHKVKIKVRRPALWRLALIRLGIRKPIPKPKPILQLVEYDDCLYVPAQNIKIAKLQFGRMFRKSNSKIKIQ